MKTPAKIDFKKQRDGKVELIEKFEVITPVFGGGVYVDQSKGHEKDHDPITPVRAASVRGQLRFWWRATQAHRFDSIEKMREKEEELWGAASKPAQIALEVEGRPADAPFNVFQWVPSKNNPKKKNLYPIRGKEGLGYGAFPLRPEASKHPEGTPPGILTTLSGECALKLWVPANAADDIRQTLDAWLLFGGVGGRTRRGFGAVRSVLHRQPAHPREFLDRFKGKRAIAGVSSLCDAGFALGPIFDDDTEALNRGLDRFHYFRQGADFGRNKGDGPHHPGRSRWPEADTIRQLTATSSAKHSRPEVWARKFPRAAFGMPIIFHFKDEKQGDPRDTELRPEGNDRRASPLIIRPVRVGEHVRPLALVLNDPQRAREPLILKGTFKRSPAKCDGSLTNEEARAIQPLDGETDPLVAFLNFFADKHAR